MDVCPHPMPWTTWNCHCPSQTSFQATDIFGTNNNPDNLPACNCGQEKRRRYQICSDKDQTDGITCQKVGEELAKTGTCAGGFSDYSQQVICPNLTVRCESRIENPKLVEQANSYDPLWMRPYLQRNQLNQPNVGDGT